VTALLATKSLSLRFGGLDALSGVTLEIPDLSLFAVIGPNGAGKTSFFNCLTGFYRPTGGSVTFDGADITRLPAHRVAALGIRRTFQNVRVFPRLSARENVLIGAHLRASASPFGTVLGTPGMRRRERALAEEAEHWLDYVGLGDKAGVLAADLAYGVRKRLEVARALIARPRVLLLDEPAAGVSGVTVVIIEHDVELVMQLAKTVAVLDRGRLLVEGEPEAVRNDERVIEAYLGRRRR
jgi:branched-chain amino acid transport system ATP-binding protein